jgi:hypothetical protein
MRTAAARSSGARRGVGPGPGAKVVCRPFPFQGRVWRHQARDVGPPALRRGRRKSSPRHLHLRAYWTNDGVCFFKPFFHILGPFGSPPQVGIGVTLSHCWNSKRTTLKDTRRNESYAVGPWGFSLATFHGPRRFGSPQSTCVIFRLRWRRMCNSPSHLAVSRRP